MYSNIKKNKNEALKVWLAQTGEPLPLQENVRKMRTALLTDALLLRGHRVLWWASAFGHQQKKWITDKNKSFKITKTYSIRTLRGFGYRRNISVARYFDHQIVAWKFRLQAARFGKPDIIIASMPDHMLAYEMALFAERNKIPFVIDVRDLWPDIFLDRLNDTLYYGLGKIFMAYDYYRLKSTLKTANAIIAVSEGYLGWALKKIRRPKSKFDKVFYLGYKGRNSGSEESIRNMPAWLEEHKGQLILLFIGTFGLSYELELVVKAAEYFSRLGRNDICFVLAGDGEKFKRIFKSCAGLKNIVLPGWIGEKEISVLLRRGYAGILCYVKDAPQGLPNKPFEYLSAGLPLINSLSGEMAELVDRNRIGLNYHPGDLEEFCACIKRLTSDQKLYEATSKAAVQFFQTFASAEIIYNEYAKHIEKIAVYGK